MKAKREKIYLGDSIKIILIASLIVSIIINGVLLYLYLSKPSAPVPPTEKPTKIISIPEKYEIKNSTEIYLGRFVDYKEYVNIILYEYGNITGRQAVKLNYNGTNISAEFILTKFYIKFHSKNSVRVKINITVTPAIYKNGTYLNATENHTLYKSFYHYRYYGTRPYYIGEIYLSLPSYEGVFGENITYSNIAFVLHIHIKAIYDSSTIEKTKIATLFFPVYFF